MRNSPTFGSPVSAFPANFTCPASFLWCFCWIRSVLDNTFALLFRSEASLAKRSTPCKSSAPSPIKLSSWERSPSSWARSRARSSEASTLSDWDSTFSEDWSSSRSCVK